MSKWIIQSDPARLITDNYLVSQSNMTHLLVSQKNLNPARPTTDWWVKQVVSRVHLIKKNIIYLFIF